MSERGGSTRNYSGDAKRSGCSVEENSNDAPVLSQIHVSCYVTAANRATPVFEVVPLQNCVRVTNKSTIDSPSGVSSGGGAPAGAILSGAGPSADWEFNSVFSSSSSSHAVDFFTEITLPALRTARDGINSNVVLWGVHPTQKFRLLFGKSVGEGGFAPQPEMALDDVVDLYGQLVGMLHAFFSRLDLGSQRPQDHETEPWRLGISSWIIVNNQAIDVLKTPTAIAVAPINAGSQVEPLSFVSLEASSLAAAFRIVQTAKTNRIVRKQNAESVHFFVRLALFHDGQVSTVHLVDLIDQKDFQEHILVQEKLELYNILHGLRQSAPSPRRSGSCVGVPAGKTVLSNFMLPLLTANAKTFFYANVIDSRSSLRESVQMMNAMANLRGFACVCKPLRGVSFDQLDFQASSKESERQEFSSQGEQVLKTPFVSNSAVGSALSHPASSPPLCVSQSAVSFASQTLAHQFLSEQPPSSNGAHAESEAMSWLSAFAQRKRDILGGSIGTVDTMAPTIRNPENPVMDAPLSGIDGREEEELEQNFIIPETRPSINDLYEQLRESLEDVKEIELARSVSPRTSYCSLHSLPPDRLVPEPHAPLPIADQDDNEEISVEVGYSRNTMGGITRHQLEQQNDEVPTSWNQTNYAASNRPIDCSTPRYDEVTSGSPEVDLGEHKEMPALTDTPVPIPASSAVPSKPDVFTLPAFKKAGISRCVMEPPKLDGLDVKTAQKVQAADATLLRKNYDALLSIVREQQQAKEAAEARAAEALQDQEELRAMFEVQIENMKLANVGLRSKVRALENRTSLPTLFEQYEQELRTFHAQVQELQARNVALELKGSSSDGRGGIVVRSGGPSSTDFKKKYQQVVEEKLALEREVMEYRRKERYHQVNSRMAGESTRRVDQLSRDLNNKEEDLVAARLSKQRLNAEMNQALEKADQLHLENEKLLQEKAASTEELLATRMYLASLENEKKKASMLDRFVEKHGDRMNKLRRHGQSSSGSKESWIRDQYARECEDKLLAAVKRSLPQAVPLCTKLLRRLEMQELSLREFSEREVDFINLLVELVSDQPTVSLKQMIEEEMNKLPS